MKYFGLIFILVISLFGISCKKEKDTNVYIRFVNETGKDIENAKVNGVLLGSIPAGSVTSYKSFADLYMYGSDDPIFQFSGNINGNL